MKLSWLTLKFLFSNLFLSLLLSLLFSLVFATSKAFADNDAVIDGCVYSSMTAGSNCLTPAQIRFYNVMGRRTSDSNKSESSKVFSNPYNNTNDNAAANRDLFYRTMSAGGARKYQSPNSATSGNQTSTSPAANADASDSAAANRDLFYRTMGRSAPATMSQVPAAQTPDSVGGSSDSSAAAALNRELFNRTMGRKAPPEVKAVLPSLSSPPVVAAPAQQNQQVDPPRYSNDSSNSPLLAPYEEHNGATSAPVYSGSADFVIESDQLKPQTPILPTQTINDKLESYCPDCARAKDAAYQEKFAGFNSIKEQLAGEMLKNAAHDMMKIVHMNCNADKVFVPTNYVTDLVYFKGDASQSSRLQGKLTDMIDPDQITKFKNDQVNGDIYRVPISAEVAKAKVSDSKSDDRTCEDLHDRPPIFYVRGRASYSKDRMDPFSSRAQKALTDDKAHIADCASTLNSIFAASGLKFSPKDMTYASAYNKSTSAMVSLAYASEKDKNSCLSIPTFKGEDSIHSGDVFVLNRNTNGKTDPMGHTLMFDDVRQDPFNLAGITKPEECVGKNSLIQPSQFHFSIVQSSGSTVDRQTFERFKGIDLTVEQHYDDLGGAPVACGDDAQPRTCDMRARFEDWGAHILKMAEKACLAKTMPNKEFRPTEKIDDRFSTSKLRVSSDGVLIRHKGPSPACLFAQPPEIVGAKCVAGCLSK